MGTLRKQYLDGTLTHREYYRHINKLAGLSMKDHPIIERAKKSTDEHLNDIPLQHWDQIAYSAQHSLQKAFKECGDFYSMAGGVCCVKQSVRDIIDGINQ